MLGPSDTPPAVRAHWNEIDAQNKSDWDNLVREFEPAHPLSPFNEFAGEAITDLQARRLWNRLEASARVLQATICKRWTEFDAWRGFQHMATKGKAEQFVSSRLQKLKPWFHRQVREHNEKQTLRGEGKLYAEAEANEKAPNSIRLVTEVWHLCYGTETGEYPKKGHGCMEWLAKLLGAPNRSLSVAELRGDPEGRLAADALLVGELETDRDGVKAIKKRLKEIEDITEETGGSEALENEKARLLHQLEDAGDCKQITNRLRKTHHNMATQIRRLRDKKLVKNMPNLAAHLKATLKFDIPDFGYYPPHGTPSWKI